MLLACPVWPPDTRLYSDRRLAAGSRTSSTLALYADLVTCYLVTRCCVTQVRSCSLGHSPHLLLPLGHHQRTNLSRQTSVSDGGGKMICPRCIFYPRR